jgi:Receptor family ligand binding region
VYAVIVSHDDKDSSGHDLSPAAVSYTSGFYQIPVIGISSRDAAFSDKNIHVSFLRTVPPYYHQADVWLEMLSHFGYTKVSCQIAFLSQPFASTGWALRGPEIGNLHISIACSLRLDFHLLISETLFTFFLLPKPPQA